MESLLWGPQRYGIRLTTGHVWLYRIDISTVAVRDTLNNSGTGCTTMDTWMIWCGRAWSYCKCWGRKLQICAGVGRDGDISSIWILRRECVNIRDVGNIIEFLSKPPYLMLRSEQGWLQLHVSHCVFKTCVRRAKQLLATKQCTQRRTVCKSNREPIAV